MAKLLLLRRGVHIFFKDGILFYTDLQQLIVPFTAQCSSTLILGNFGEDSQHNQLLANQRMHRVTQSDLKEDKTFASS